MVRAAGILVGTEGRHPGGHFLDTVLELVGGKTSEKSVLDPIVLMLFVQCYRRWYMQGGPSPTHQLSVGNM